MHLFFFHIDFIVDGSKRQFHYSQIEPINNWFPIHFLLTNLVLPYTNHLCTKGTLFEFLPHTTQIFCVFFSFFFWGPKHTTYFNTPKYEQKKHHKGLNFGRKKIPPQILTCHLISKLRDFFKYGEPL